MNRYLCSLTENCTDQVLTDFDAFGAKVVWVSHFMPNLVSIETEKTLNEVRGFFLVETANEEAIGTFN